MTTNIYSTVYPYPKIGADACGGCTERAVVVNGTSQDWTMTQQGSTFTFALDDWSAIPSSDETQVLVSVNPPAQWQVIFDDGGNLFTVQLSGTGLFWTLSDTNTGSAIELQPSNGGSNQVFSVTQPSN